jgi:hypothetical protein
VLEGGRLLVMVGGQPDSTVVAFDPKDGKTLWQSVGSRNWTGQPMLGWPGDQKVQWKPWEKTASYASLIPATVGGRRVVHAVTRQGLVVLDPADGTPLFSRWFRARVDESVNAMTPLVVGDEVLIATAKRVSEVLRGTDSVARLGGDEFVVLAEDMGDTQGAVRVAVKVRDALARPIEVRGRALQRDGRRRRRVDVEGRHGRIWADDEARALLQQRRAKVGVVDHLILLPRAPCRAHDWRVGALNRTQSALTLG